MGPSIAENKVRERFSDAALRYDTFSDVHRSIADELIERILAAGVEGPLLDVGMGTGWLTKRLADVFPGSTVVGCDLADGMVARARERQGGFKIVQAHACALPFAAGTFGLITSNLAYQWVNDLPRAFSVSRACLKEGGRMMLTMSGSQTLQELFASLHASSGKVDTPVRHFADKARVVAALECAGFRDIKVESQERTISFPDMMALVRWVKGIGANALPTDMFIGRGLLQRAGAYYREHFRGPSGIRATFEVIWIEAER